ncbi:serine/threonine-protein kinase [Stigmatella erecta]|uniref:Serine/threonine protein kinase n=1 Tax=Stigmatella erecta TaxID=83460 RepID=A0A1I0L3W3_9BACT|nr:serine/threonine-protein kinase [Stigmatella erecta]SEU33999.1 serine/threonine protein kinase [Stigmatella erecta]
MSTVAGASTPEVQLGKYRLLKLLATGGMGEVFLARQEGPAGFAKTVVIKRMLAHLGRDPKFVEMFLNEARLAAELSHPNIVQIFELGEHAGTYFLAMEFIHGVNLRTLKRRLDERHLEVPAGLAAFICAQALKGLHYAHTLTDEAGKSMNIVHRDVSPDNVLVGFNGTVKMVDFGIAKASSSISTTNAGTVKGKYAYMSPEQLSGQKADPRTDVYAMGIVLYELITGGRPFQGPSEGALVRSILQDTPKAPRDVRPGLAPELEELTLRAIARNPQERFASAESMATALEAYALGEGGMTQHKVKGLLRGLFSEEADIISAVGARPKSGGSLEAAPGASQVGNASVHPGTSSALKKTGDAPPQTSAQWVNVDLSTHFTVSIAEVPLPPPPSAAAVPAPPPKRRFVPWLVAGGGVAALLVGVGVTLPALREPAGAPPARVSLQTLEPVEPKAPPPAPVAVSATALPQRPPPEAAAAATPAAQAQDAPGEALPEAEAPEEATAPEAPRAPAAKRAARPGKHASGTVSLRVNPWAEVLYAGKSLGVTPMAPFELPSGTHTLTLVNQDLDVKRKVRVVVPANKQVVLRINLLDGM